MLNLAASKPLEHKERAIATGVTVPGEGVPLVRVLENGLEHVKPCTGAAGEIFVGFSWMHNVLPIVATRVEAIKVPAAGAAQEVYLKRNNLVATQISIMFGAAQFTEVGAAPAASEYICDDVLGKLTFNAGEADAGKTLYVTYKYTPTGMEIKTQYKAESLNTYPAFEFLGSLGVITLGELYTDQFDASVDWSVVPNNSITLGVGVLSAGGAVSIGGHVTHVPSADNPFLGVQFSNH